MVKNSPAMQETQVRPLSWEDPPRRGNGNPLLYSCLENSMVGFSSRGHKESDVSERVTHTHTLTNRHTQRHSELQCLLGWPKSWLRLFHKMLYKNPNKLFRYPNTLYYAKAKQRRFPVLLTTETCPSLSTHTWSRGGLQFTALHNGFQIDISRHSLNTRPWWGVCIKNPMPV